MTSPPSASGPRPPVFVVGSPRSGTTWLYHLLLSSGGFAIYRAESRVFDVIGPRFGDLRRRSDRARFLSQWLDSELFHRSGLDADEISARVLEDCGSAGDFLRLFMDGIAAMQGARRWAECTPTNVFHAREIKASFPNAQFIHMVRDGRDVALSLSKQGWIRAHRWDRARPHVPAALYWEWMVQAGRAAGRFLGTDFLEVRFEELVGEPHLVLDRIGRFVGHAVDYERIQRQGIGSVSRPNTSFVSGVEESTFRPVERWKSAAPRVVREVERCVGPTLRELGYALADDTPLGSAPALDRANRLLYRAGFAGREWLKSQTPLGRWFTDTSILEWKQDGDLEDKTVRPGLHQDFVRSLVRADGS